MDCLFCKIRDGEIPSDKLYEDDKVFVILDINPVNPGHALVITKDHFQDTSETPDEVVAHLAKISKVIGQALLKVLDYPAYNIGVNNGAAAGQLIMHTHWHVMPRQAGDGHTHWKGSPYEEGQAVEIVQKIKSQL